jgi:hypothetical protein
LPPSAEALRIWAPALTGRFRRKSAKIGGTGAWSAGAQMRDGSNFAAFFASRSGGALPPSAEVRRIWAPALTGRFRERERERERESWAIGCVAVKSRSEDRTHCVRSEDSQQLQCRLESEFQRCRTLRLPKISIPSAGVSAVADPDTFCFEETSTGAVRSHDPFPQLPPLGSAALATVGTLSTKFRVPNILRGEDENRGR